MSAIAYVNGSYRPLRDADRERDPPVEQRAGDVPGGRELSDLEAVRLGPDPLAVVGGAVVTDRLRDLEVRRGHAPEGGERAQANLAQWPSKSRHTGHSRQLKKLQVAGSAGDLVAGGVTKA